MLLTRANNLDRVGGKKEDFKSGVFETDPLYCIFRTRERTSDYPFAIREDIQRNLFADPNSNIRRFVQSTQHDVDRGKSLDPW